MNDNTVPQADLPTVDMSLFVGKDGPIWHPLYLPYSGEPTQNVMARATSTCQKPVLLRDLVAAARVHAQTDILYSNNTQQNQNK